MAKALIIDLGSLAFDTSQIDPTLAKTYAKLGAWVGNIQSKLKNLEPGFDESKLFAQEAKIKAWAARVSSDMAKQFSRPMAVASGLTIEAAVPGSNAGTIARMQAVEASARARADLSTQSRIGERAARGSFSSEIDAATSRRASTGIVAVGAGADVANQHFMRLNRTVSIANTALSATASESSTASRSLFQLVGFAEQARIGMLAYGMSTKAAFASIAIGGGLVAIGAVFEYIAHKQDEAIEKWQEHADRVGVAVKRYKELKDAAIESGFGKATSAAELLTGPARSMALSDVESDRSTNKIKRLAIERDQEPVGSAERRNLQKQISDELFTAANKRQRVLNDIRDVEEEGRRESERAYTEFNQRQQGIIDAYEDRIVAERKLKAERLSGSAQSILQGTERFRPSDFEQDPRIAEAMRESERNANSPAGRVFARDLGSLNRGLAGSTAIVDSGNGQKIERNTALTAATVKALLEIVRASGAAVALSPNGGGLSESTNN